MNYTLNLLRLEKGKQIKELESAKMDDSYKRVIAAEAKIEQLDDAISVLKAL